MRTSPAHAAGTEAPVSAATAEKVPEFPQVFGRYVLLAPIAAGGMAEVFLADMVGPLGFRRRVALKRIHRHLGSEAAFIRSFIDEARVGAQLRHPNIVTTRDLQLVDGQPCLEMDYVEGGHLGMVIHRAQLRRQPLPYAFVLDLARQLARGLAFAHTACDPRGRPLELIHRDIKPSNLLLGFDGVLRLVDFGIARASNNLSHTHPDTVKGSLAYMSPEQARAERQLGPATDLFSVGAVLFELLTRQRLYPADGVGLLLALVARGPTADTLKPLLALPAEQQPLVKVVQKLLAVEVQERIPSAIELRDTLDGLPNLPAMPEEQRRWAQEWLDAVRLPVVPELPEGSDAQARLHLDAVLNRSLTPTQALQGADLAKVLGARASEPLRAGTRSQAMAQGGTSEGGAPPTPSAAAGGEALNLSSSTLGAAAEQGDALVMSAAPLSVPFAPLPERGAAELPPTPSVSPVSVAVPVTSETPLSVAPSAEAMRPPPAPMMASEKPKPVAAKRWRALLLPVSVCAVALMMLLLLQGRRNTTERPSSWLYVVGPSEVTLWQGQKKLGSPPFRVRLKQASAPLELTLESSGKRQALPSVPQEGGLLTIEPEGVRLMPLSAALLETLEASP